MLNTVSEARPNLEPIHPVDPADDKYRGSGGGHDVPGDCRRYGAILHKGHDQNKHQRQNPGDCQIVGGVEGGSFRFPVVVVACG